MRAFAKEKSMAHEHLDVRVQRLVRGEDDMDSSDTCPATEQMAAYCDHLLAPDETSTVESHLAACYDCRALLVSRLEASEHFPPERRTFTLPRVAAAAVLLMAGGGLCLLQFHVRHQGIRKVLEGFVVAGVGQAPLPIRPGEELRAGSGGASVNLPDGTRVGLSSGAVARLAAPRAGERLRFRMEAGEASFDVAHAEGAVVVEVPLGEVRVVGTRFDVRLWPDFPDAGGAPRLLEVEVISGLVTVIGHGASVHLGRSERAYVQEGAVPVTHVVGSVVYSRDTGEIVRKLEAVLPGAGPESFGPESRLLVAVLRHHGRAAAILGSRVEDAGRTAPERAGWGRALAALGEGSRVERSRLRGVVRDPEILRALGCDPHSVGEGEEDASSDR